jgi:DNA polymerase type B, organellar and viral
MRANDITAYNPDGSVLARIGDFRSESSAGLRFAETARFVMWDGEACKDAGYCYFANSLGGEMLAPRQLSSQELLDFIFDSQTENIQSSKGVINIGYGFDYDVDNILMDMPKRLLAILGRYNKARWRIGSMVYRVEYIPRKIFAVSRYIRSRSDAVGPRYTRTGYFKLFDVVSYFNCRYDKALRTYHVGDPETIDKIEAGKEDREFFLYKNIQNIIDYCKLELTMGPQLMDKLRAAVHGAGYKTQQWYGPGAISKLMLKQNHFRKAMSSEVPSIVAQSSRYAYAGGWFERFSIGYHDGPVWVPDINSAYPYALSQVPNLRTGTWTHVDDPDPSLARKYRLALFKIRYDIPREQWEWTNRVYPLFRRQDNGSIIHAPRVENWYHAPEAATVADDPNATFLEAWIYQDDGTYPCDWVNEAYHKRLQLQRDGNPAELGIKLGLNAAYGTIAQQCGWDRDTCKPPSWHQLELAGFITSMCRAMLYEAGKPVAGQIISHDTDGLMTTADPGIRNGDALGEWKVKKYSGILMLQNGLYWLRDGNGDWLPPKTRGIARRRIPLGREEAERILGGSGSVRFEKRMYIGFRSALHRNWSDRGKWIDVPTEINIHTSGNRRHYTIAPELECEQCKAGMTLMDGLHACSLMFSPKSGFESKPHDLEWLNPEEKEKRFEEWLIKQD